MDDSLIKYDNLISREDESLNTYVNAVIFKTFTRTHSEINSEKLESIRENLIVSLYRTSGIIPLLTELRLHHLYTYEHSINTAIICALLGFYSHLENADIINLITAGSLHDLGKLKVSTDILNKSTRLNDNEYKIIREHPIESYKRVLGIESIPQAVKEGILYHHERENGRGYPSGRESEDIPLYAKITAVSDVYDAIVSIRPYHKVYTIEETKQEMYNVKSGLDLDIVDTLFTKIVE